jgi:hypothetical protein
MLSNAPIAAGERKVPLNWCGSGAFAAFRRRNADA